MTPFVGATESEARAKYDELNALVAPELGLSYLCAAWGSVRLPIGKAGTATRSGQHP